MRGVLRRLVHGPPAVRRGETVSHLTYGVIAALVVTVVVFFGFTKHVPFTHGFRLNAVFQNANEIVKGTQVRIAGVNVGKVTKVTRYKDSNAARVADGDRRRRAAHPPRRDHRRSGRACSWRATSLWI